jgi:PiT family inorganic phosphate transporter
MDLTLVLLVTVIAVGLVFDFVNGFHDAANAIATVVVSRALSPLQAVLLAAFANFLGYFFFGVTVAKTIGTDVVQLSSMTLPLILAALTGAVAWNIITWVWGLPTSSSHALIGGLVGAALAAAGPGAVIVGGVLKIVGFIVLAPLLGFVGAAVLTTLLFWLFRRAHPGRTRGFFKGLQLVASAYFATTHGANDSQKTMAVIAMALVAAGVHATLVLDPWVIFSCYLAISLGTAFGGWRIIRTMGTNIIKIRALEGFASNASAGGVLMMTALLGIPVSTTHVISGAIMGVGAVENAARVRWITARRIVWAWIVTIPAAGLIAAAAFLALRLLPA